jgi:riboflavin synthase
MFTGIIKELGTITEIIQDGSSLHLWVSSPLTPNIAIDNSIAHNGICLTVVAIKDNAFKVTAVEETIKKTTIAHWRVGDSVNLERALKIGDGLDGHFVQGHVDTIANCKQIEFRTGSWLFDFEFDANFAALIIEKGSIAINGVSLTVFNVERSSFSVTIIPYTFEHTNFNSLQIGQKVNLEFDILGKYFLRKMHLEA